MRQMKIFILMNIIDFCEIFFVRQNYILKIFTFFFYVFFMLRKINRNNLFKEYILVTLYFILFLDPKLEFYELLFIESKLQFPNM